MLAARQGLARGGSLLSNQHDIANGQGGLFDCTSCLAGRAAVKSIGKRQRRILEILASRGPSTIFEVAGAMDLNDHQISGRFSELERSGIIQKTGHRRPKPETGCLAEVYVMKEDR